MIAPVENISLDERTVTLSDGTVLPITDMLDEDGDDCDAEDAVSIVAGIQGVGFLSIDLDFIEPVTLH